jgi:hypothetical protein
MPHSVLGVGILLGSLGIMSSTSLIQSRKQKQNVNINSLWKSSLVQHGRYGNKEINKSSEEIKLPFSLGKHVLYII